MSQIALTLLILTFFLLAPTIHAKRITPEDIVNSKKQAYSQKIAQYSQGNKQKLEQVSKKIAETNKKRTGELSRIMLSQGEILDEYQKRLGDKSNDSIEKSRYWITFAHEAVAYQAAKIYVFDLTSEASLNNDAFATINKFQSELNYARAQVIKSQGILESVIKK